LDLINAGKKMRDTRRRIETGSQKRASATETGTEGTREGEREGGEREREREGVSERESVCVRERELKEKCEK
jgi:hypothetical protein